MAYHVFHFIMYFFRKRYDYHRDISSLRTPFVSNFSEKY